MIGLLDWVGPFFLIIVLVGIFLFRSYSRTRSDRERRRQSIKTSAKILEVGHSRASEKNNDIVVDLTLEITAPDGIAHQSKVRWRVEPASAFKVQAGNNLAIKIDPKNPELIYSAEKGIQDMNH